MTSPEGLVGRPASAADESEARYSEYVSSGIEWLGEVPSHWQTRRLRWTGDFRGGGTPSKSTEAYWDGKIPWVSPKDMKDFRLKDTSDHISERGLAESTTSLVPRGSVLLVVRSGILRRTLPVAIAEREVALNQDLKAIVPYEEVEVDYLGYWIRAHQGPLLAEWRKEGTTVESLESDLIKNTWITLPPRSAQRAISRFLDDKTAQIDLLIDKKGRLIELLEERRTALITKAVTKGLDPDVPRKDSGVEWLDEIPKHWDVAPVKYLAQLETGHTPSRSSEEYWQDCHIPWFTLADVGDLRTDRIERATETEEKISELGIRNSSARLLPEGTVMLSRTASVGFSAMMGRPMATSQDFVNWVCGDDLLAEYLLYVFRAMRPELQRLVMGSTHKTIYMPDIENLRTPLPPLEEQRQIVNEIRDRSRDVLLLVDKVREAMSTLREYRSALITAAVTGKIDVRDQAA